ncbi:MAG: tetratricopeptide repeat protein [Magnetococcales bacterium]|nr:tetratricopeptide repeat protein [Magnetococcales bacterium]
MGREQDDRVAQDPALLASAVAHHQRGALEAAGQLYRRILAQDPRQPDALHLLGLVHHQQGDGVTARDLIGAALAWRPDDAAFWNNLGEVHRGLGEFDRAADCYRQALRLRPAYADAQFNLGLALEGLGRTIEAEQSYRQALAWQPDHPGAHNNLGWMLARSGRREEGQALLRRVLERHPVFAEAHNNLGILLQEEGRLEAATACFEAALIHRPGFVDALLNLGNTLQYQGNRDGARNCFETVLTRHPGHALARFGLGVDLLLRGRYREGWPWYEARLEEGMCRLTGQTIPSLPHPRWRGEPLAGRRILLVPEQGFGDQLQFWRFAPRLAAAGAQVDLAVPAPLWELARSLPGVGLVPLERLLALGSYDYWTFLLSLPWHLDLDQAGIAMDRPYVAPPPARSAQWRQRLAQGSAGRIRVGLVWSGNPEVRFDRFRSVPFDELAMLFRVPGIAFISLQRGAVARAAAPPPGTNWLAVGDEIGDFADTAALLDNLDLLISVDSAPAHLAGAQGVPVWTLVRHNHDWRWLPGETRTPWYPAMRVFPQARLGEWGPVLAEVADGLAGLLAGGGLS